MTRNLASSYRRAWPGVIAGGLLIFAAACGGDKVGPSETLPPEDPTVTAPPDTTPPDTTHTTPIDSTGTLPGDSSATNPDSTQTPPPDTTGGQAPTIDPQSIAPGIVFGSFNMPKEVLGAVHTGMSRNLDPPYLLSELAAARAKGARVMVKLVKGRDSYIKNPDGTFSFTKWKALVDRYRTVDFSSYLADGTLMGHYLIDEPHLASKWGGKPISQATVEAMAKYSKGIWPAMNTFVRVVPSWLEEPRIPYTYLDAGYAQYAARLGDPTKWVSAEVASAQRQHLGLVVSMNVLGGGNGSSRIPYDGRLYAMSASEIRTYGTALLNQSYACGFFMWAYDAGYYGRSDIQSAMADLSIKAKTHIRTSCRQ